MRYDTAQPRISIISPGDSDGVQREMEIGQASSWGEAEFFCRVLGYRISISRWDGQCFREDQYLLPQDYL